MNKNEIKLNKNEVNVLSHFYYQVNNGGLAQYIGNGYATDEASDLLEVLDKCELNETEKSLQGNYYYQNGTCEYCNWGCQDTCEDDYNEDEENEGYEFDLENDCSCECDCYNMEDYHEFDELENHNEYTEPASWDDGKFYDGEESVRIEAILNYNDGFVSRTGSIILDALTKGE